MCMHVGILNVMKRPGERFRVCMHVGILNVMKRQGERF